MRFFKWMLLVLLPNVLFATAPCVNIYNWDGYLPSDIIQLFEQRTGIHVNLATVADNDTLYTKLKISPGDVDIAVPSGYYVNRLRENDLLQPLQVQRLRYRNDVMPILRHPPYDPRLYYSLPYFWGTTLIAVNRRSLPTASIHRWHDFWSPERKRQLLLLDEPREVFAMALLTLGYPINDNNPLHIKAAFQQLVKLIPNIKLFDEDQIKSIYLNEDAVVGMALSGDLFQASQYNPHLQAIFPKEGAILWTDCIVIPKHAPHLSNAYRFINFIMQPEIAAMLSEETGYATPSVAAFRRLPATLQHNTILYPTPRQLQHAHVEANMTPHTNRLILQYWERLKLML